MTIKFIEKPNIRFNKKIIYEKYSGEEGASGDENI